MSVLGAMLVLGVPMLTTGLVGAFVGMRSALGRMALREQELQVLARVAAEQAAQNAAQNARLEQRVRILEGLAIGGDPVKNPGLAGGELANVAQADPHLI